MTRTNKTSRIENEIDQNLKRAYDEVANEAVPQHLTDLLAQLRAQDAAKSSDQDPKDE
ncbi:MAG: NepR family anti-sigma factor [Pseudomonadota bacterium]